MNEELRTAGALAKDPNALSWLAYAWICFLAVWGGVARVMREVRVTEKTWRQLAWIFLSEMTTSGFVGVITFYACQAADVRPALTAVMVGVSGWMGVRALAVFEAIFKARFQGGIDGEKR